MKPTPRGWPRISAGVVYGDHASAIDFLVRAFGFQPRRKADALGAGALTVDGPSTNDHGEEYWADCTHRAAGPEGHHWFFIQRLRDPKPGAKGDFGD